MRKFFIVGTAIFWVLSGTALANKLEDVKKRGTLICGTQSTSAPYAYQDGATRTFVGYDVDMCKALAEGLEVKLEHRALSTEARIPEVKLGRVDLVAGSVSYLPERAEQVDFSLQYLQTKIRVMVKESSKLKTLANLAGKRICASKGSAAAAIAGRVLPDSQVMSFQDVASCNLALQSGKVEGFSAGELILTRFANQTDKSKDPYFLIEEPIAIERIGIILDKGHPEFLAAVNEAIVKMDKSGKLDEIFNRWVGKDSEYGLSRNFTVSPVNPMP